ncbi:MAG TPA: hypothetical protein VEA19_03000 [Actinomycetota bacterium]|nr:hypothetical protein [Actinomycetota bacterium]
MIPFFVTVAATTLVLLVVLVIALVRQVTRLAETLGGFRDELQPVVEGIRRDSERTQERLEALQRRRTAGA